MGMIIYKWINLKEYSIIRKYQDFALIFGTISTFILVIGMVSKISNTAYAQSLSEFILLLLNLGLTNFDSEGQCKHTLKEKLPQIISNADFDIKSKEVTYIPTSSYYN